MRGMHQEVKAEITQTRFSLMVITAFEKTQGIKSSAIGIEP